MAKTVGEVRINITAGTAQMILDLEKANAKVRDFGKSVGSAGAAGGQAFRHIGDGAGHAVSGLQATSGTLRVLEGNLNNNLRAAERFLANTLGLGPALQAIFPIVGGIAMIGIVAHLAEQIDKAHEAFQRMQEAPARIGAEFGKLNQSIALSNAEMRVANDKLDNEIAKLSGKPQNGLKLAIDEATASAIKLGKELANDFQELSKLLKEENVGFFESLFTSEASTSKFKEYLVGKQGFGGKLAEESETTSNTQDRLHGIDQALSAGKIDEQDAAFEKAAIRARDRNEQERIYTDIVKRSNEELKKAQDLQAKREIEKYRLLPLNGVTFIPDQEVNIGISRKAGGFAQGELERIKLEAANEQKTQTKDQLGAAVTDIDPYTKKIHELDAQLRGVQAQLAAIGQTATAETLAKSWGEAQQSIAKLNDELAKHHQSLSLNQQVEILTREDLIESAKAEEEWRKKVEQTTTSVSERIASLKLLTSAIGEGYEAQKKASVETQVAQTLGKDANDPEWLRKPEHQAQIQSLRQQFSTEYDVKQTNTVTGSLDSLSKQIELEKSLAGAEEIGATATRSVTLAYKLREIAETEGLTKTKELIQSEIDLAEAQHRSVDLTSLQSRVSNTHETSSSSQEADLQRKAQQHISSEITSSQTSESRQVAQTVAQINQEIAATERLTAAQLGGAEAVRKAQLENRVAEIKRNDPAEYQQPKIDAATKLSEAHRQEQVVTEAVSKGESYQNRLNELDQEIHYLQSIKGTKEETLATDISLHELEKEQAKVYADQVQVLGSARDGLRAYFQELSTEGTSAAQQVHDAFKKAFDSLNESLSKLVAGQKVNWASLFQSISSELTKSSLKNLEASFAAKFFPQQTQQRQGQQQGGFRSVIGGIFGAPQSPGGTPPFLPGNLAGAKLPTQGLGSRDGQSAASSLFVTTTDASTASNPAPSSAAAPEDQTGGSGDSNAITHLISGASGLLKIFGGFRASGGDVDAGQAHVVGEDGPEFFIPDSDGLIVPNEKLASFQRQLAMDGGGTRQGSLQSFWQTISGTDADSQTDLNATANRQAAAQDQHPEAFDNAQSNAHVSDVSLPTNTASFLEVLTGSLGGGKGSSHGSSGSGGSNKGIPTWDPSTNQEVYSDGTRGAVGWTPGGNGILQGFGGTAGITTTAIGVGLGLLSRLFNQPHDHHFKNGQPFVIPNFNGAFADGGEVKAGKTHLVGEKGKEVFVSREKLSEIGKAFESNAYSDSKTTHTSSMERLRDFGKSGSIIGAFADGGTVQKGKTSLVGEKGPELFMSSALSMGSGNNLFGSALSGPFGLGSAFHGIFGSALTGPLGPVFSKGSFGEIGSAVTKGFGPVTSGLSGGSFLSGGLIGNITGGGYSLPSASTFSASNYLPSTPNLGSIGSSIGSSFSSIGTSLSHPFGGFKASGGAVSAGYAYMVGEQGPEMWTPPSSGGSIVPNHDLQSGGGAPAINNYIDARGTDPQAVEQRIRQANAFTYQGAVRSSFKAREEWEKRRP